MSPKAAGVVLKGDKTNETSIGASHSTIKHAGTVVVVAVVVVVVAVVVVLVVVVVVL